jgi:putative endonuclease
MRWSALASWWSKWRQPQSLGFRGERAAERFLKRKGYRIVARGQRVRGGELDLVAVEDRTVVFVEVKTRTSHDKGHPAEAVDQHKQVRMTRAALRFIQRHGLFDCRCRFDVVAVTWPADPKSQPAIEHYVNAFEGQGVDGMFS